MTIPVNLLAPDPEGAARATAVRHANERVLTDPALNPTATDAPPTLGEALAAACAPATTRQREPHSTQDAEWERASREVLAVLPADLPLAALSGAHVVTVAKSGMLRRAAGVDVGGWRALVAVHVEEAARSNPRHLDAALDQAYSDQQAARLSQASPITLVWPRRVVELLRAMIRFVAGRDLRFGQFGRFSTPSDFMNDVRALARRHGVTFEATPFRPTRAAEEARALMRELSDPRYLMRDALASMAGAKAARVLRASHIRLVGDGVEVKCQMRERYANRRAWHRCDAPVAEVLRALRSGPYAALEAAREAGGADYRVIADVRWNGTALSLASEVDGASERGTDDLLDPRTWLLLTLGAEGRMGQIRRAMRSDLLVEGTTDELVLDVPDAERKRASLLLAAPAQQAALAFTLRVGYLANLERAYRSGQIANYPLFPSGRLIRGRAGAHVAAYIDDRTLNDWARAVERRLGLTRVDRQGMYGWRRSFINLFDTWSTSARVKDLLTGHTDMREPTYGSTRVTVYLDPRDLVHLREGQRLLEHVRTEFVRTGAPPPPTAGGSAP
jgi:hypothetical protein